ncbi:methyltransferase domain-containing protein [Streptomyces sp. NBC_01006]|uniref:methyltransferase domain-containing protein n=1 Tax=Streptomyces sp. NBC_01006 TaxID=2903716 RepID=UPI0038657342|nr:methyltransferase domain-containing protein [Streptomyces sp. NBC_01006]
MTPGPELLRYLDEAHRGLLVPKNVMRAGLAVGPGHGILDLGCGAGHELVELESAGCRAFGVDSSSVMLEASRLRLEAHGLPVRLVHADVHDLPFADATFAGCRIERVLQHVRDPATVLAGAHRVLRPGGSLAVLEPDWASVALASADTEAARVVADAVGSHIPHRQIGRDLRRLLIEAGFTDVRTETELVVYSSLTELSHVISLERAAHVAWSGGLIARERAEALLREQLALSEAGAFHATFQRTVIAWARRPA